MPSIVSAAWLQCPAAPCPALALRWSSAPWRFVIQSYLVRPCCLCSYSNFHAECDVACPSLALIEFVANALARAWLSLSFRVGNFALLDDYLTLEDLLPCQVGRAKSCCSPLQALLALARSVLTLFLSCLVRFTNPFRLSSRSAPCLPHVCVLRRAICQLRLGGPTAESGRRSTPHGS